MADSQSTLDFQRSRTVDLSLRVVDAEHVSVEMCQLRAAGSKLQGNTIQAIVGEPFELFFRLSGEADARAQVELYHPGAEADVTPVAIDSRFTVTVTRVSGTHEEPSPSCGEAWIDDLPDDGVRHLFRHLAKHGAVTESEASSLLGSGRALRRFSREFESLAKKAPFEVRIDVIGGVKRYVREHESEYEMDNKRDDT